MRTLNIIESLCKPKLNYKSTGFILGFFYQVIYCHSLKSFNEYFGRNIFFCRKWFINICMIIGIGTQHFRVTTMRNTFDSLIQLLIVLSFCSDNSLTFSIHNIYYCSRNEVFIPIIGNSSPLESTDKKIHLPQFFSQLHNIQKSLMLRCSAKSLSLGLYSRDRWKKSFSIIFTKKVLLAIHSYYTNRIGVDGCV